MITPQELREGNWVFCFDPKRTRGPKRYLCPISWRHIRDFQLKQTEAEYSPIELTFDILLQCGWAPVESTEVFCHPKFGRYLALKKTTEGYVLVVMQYDAQVGEVIKYLHQLQNRYYSLVYEEMEVNLQAVNV